MDHNIGKFVTAIFGIAAFAGCVHAAPLIDQQNYGEDGISVNSYGAGQSFTPGLAGIDFAQFKLASQGGPSTTAVAKLFQGNGFGGTLLGTSAAVTFFSGAQTIVEFDFGSTISLVAGDVYTLQILRTEGAVYGSSYGGTDAYSGGQAFGSLGDGAPVDMWFAEGILTAVPEPATWSLMIAGFALVGSSMRRRRLSVSFG